MALTPGTRLGPYEILGPLGAGGMGEVYKGRDSRLDRIVAIKVLPSHLSSSEEMRQRFEREAKAISQISHPHICALYDVNREGETEYLVMEYLEGETLADRVARGPLPSEQLLRFGMEIADALDKAHRAGIVHRDLKPGNVMLTKSGVKLLDFGLAKYQGGSLTTASDSRLATEMAASKPLTERGSVLGTFQYMSPEQLEGKSADARSDLFAFGAVLYEMATGRKAFTGSSQASLIGAILRDDPPAITEIAPMSPPALNRVVKTCLAKDPEDRFQTAHDVKLQLQWIAEGGSQAGLPAPVATRRKSRERIAWIVAAAALAAAALATLGYLRRAPTTTAAPVRSYLLPPPKTDFSVQDADGGALTISPDGRFATFATQPSDGKTTLWLQPLAETAARPIAGAENARFPFWSPDSRSLAFFADGKLQRVDISGGPAVTICDAGEGRSGSWNREGVILFSPEPVSGILRVPAAGGKPTPVTTLDTAAGESTHRWATFLPDGRHFLYMATSHGAGSKSEVNAVYAASLDSKDRALVLQARSNVVFASGYLLYFREGILMAQRFDPAARKLSGDPHPIAQGVQYDAGFFRGSFAASDSGLLAYATGAGGTKTQPRFYDLAGKPLGEPIGEPAEYSSLAVSFDGQRIAAGIADPASGLPNVWILDERGARSRLAAGGSTDFPLWSPDGDRIAYVKIEGGVGSAICVKPFNGGPEKVLARFEKEFAKPTDWSRDGRLIAVDVLGQKQSTRSDIWIVPVSGDAKPYAFLASDSDETYPTFSPDGKWLSYISTESGRPELYVAPFPGPGSPSQVSVDGTGGGGFSGKDLEIFFGSTGTTEAMAVEMKATANGLEIGRPRPMFKAPTFTAIAVAHDGQRFLFAVPPGPAEPARIGLVSNWTAGLK